MSFFAAYMHHLQSSMVLIEFWSYGTRPEEINTQFHIPHMGLGNASKRISQDIRLLEIYDNIYGIESVDILNGSGPLTRILLRSTPCNELSNPYQHLSNEEGVALFPANGEWSVVSPLERKSQK